MSSTRARDAKDRRLTELRRALPIGAAVLWLASLALPMWRITLRAPQYPGQALRVDLYAYPRLEGDVTEIALLNKYVGFHYPDPVFVDPNFAVHEHAVAVPEWTFGPLAFVLVAGAAVVVAIAPTERKLRLGLTAHLLGTLSVFAGMFALIQYRLYQTGHSLDPDAPYRGVSEFTPPVFGPYEIANITGMASFGPGGYLALLAVVLIILGFLFRNSTATIWDLPALIETKGGRLRERVSKKRARLERDHG